MPEDRRERAKLLHKVKRETKGALREIRRDRQFLAKVKFRETMRRYLIFLKRIVHNFYLILLFSVMRIGNVKLKNFTALLLNKWEN